MAGLNRSYLSELEQGRETEQVRRILRLDSLPELVNKRVDQLRTSGLSSDRA